MDELKESIQPLSKAEIREINRSFYGTFLVALFLVSVLLGVTHFFGTSVSTEMNVVMIVFEVFFVSILLYIVAKKYQATRFNQKSVLEGILTTKITDASRAKNSNLNEMYYVVVGNRRFCVQFNHFNAIHRGHLVQLHLVADQVFKVVDLGNPNPSPKKLSPHENEIFELEMSAEDKQVVLSKLVRLVWLRTILGGIGAYVIYWLLFIGLIFGWSAFDSDLKLLVFFVKIIQVFMLLVFIGFNMKTIRMLRDYLKGVKRIVVEPVIDAIESNHEKTSLNSMISTNTSDPWGQNYYYLQSENHWIQVDESMYQAVNSDQFIEIELAKYSGLVLNVTQKGK